MYIEKLKFYELLRDQWKIVCYFLMIPNDYLIPWLKLQKKDEAASFGFDKEQVALLSNFWLKLLEQNYVTVVEYSPCIMKFHNLQHAPVNDTVWLFVTLVKAAK